MRKLARPSPALDGRSALVEIYRSDLAYWAGLVVIWELLVILVALWVLPVLLAAAPASTDLLAHAAVIGAGA
jgi:hypothetical protein